MNRHHDLGGAEGFGAVPMEDDSIFHADWERRTFAITQIAQGLSGFNTDAFRHGIERDTAEQYRQPYFNRWLRNAERMLVEGGVVAPDALDAFLAGGSPVGSPRRTTDAEPHGDAGNRRSVGRKPRFAVGDSVRCRAGEPNDGHHRRPSYVEGRQGVVVEVHDAWVFPDSHAHGRGESAQFVYGVRFSSAEIWGEGSHHVHVDLFEPYLEAP